MQVTSWRGYKLTRRIFTGISIPKRPTGELACRARLHQNVNRVPGVLITIGSFELFELWRRVLDDHLMYESAAG